MEDEVLSLAVLVGNDPSLHSAILDPEGVENERGGCPTRSCPFTGADEYSEG